MCLDRLIKHWGGSLEHFVKMTIRQRLLILHWKFITLWVSMFALGENIKTKTKSWATLTRLASYPSPTPPLRRQPPLWLQGTPTSTLSKVSIRCSSTQSTLWCSRGSASDCIPWQESLFSSPPAQNFPGCLLNRQWKILAWQKSKSFVFWLEKYLLFAVL
jgi:hypothetical protein